MPGERAVLFAIDILYQTFEGYVTRSAADLSIMASVVIKDGGVQGNFWSGVFLSCAASVSFGREEMHDRRERVKKSCFTVNAAECDCFARGMNECLFLS